MIQPDEVREPDPELTPGRLLAASVVGKAVADLTLPSYAMDAARFLLVDLRPSLWGAWLPLPNVERLRAVVRSTVCFQDLRPDHAQAVRRLLAWREGQPRPVLPMAGLVKRT